MTQIPLRGNPDVGFAFLNKPTPDQVRQIIYLYRREKWWSDGDDNPDLVARIVSGSHCFIVAVLDDKIIGMGRSISDGASDAYIQDVAVKEKYRGLGIGSKIIEALLHRLHSDGLGWVGLIAERGSHEFYSRLGFKPMPESVPMLKIKA
ncbi:MAG: GNAT family N-acetyltransferase [Desulfobacterales bacterium]|nr:GNAT family N-acetyltransferase [Desulfobacterales bacterium]